MVECHLSLAYYPILQSTPSRCQVVWDLTHSHWFVLSGFQVKWSLEVNSAAVVFLFCVFRVKQTVRAHKDALDGIYFGKTIRLWLHSWGPAQRALGNKPSASQVLCSARVFIPVAPPLPPQTGPECLCLFPANVSQICWHGNLGVGAGRQSASRTYDRGGDGLSSLPTMQFAYGRCHQGAGPCQLRVTCPLPLLYVIIEPICSAQQGLDGNHEAAIGKMEGKCEGVWGGLVRMIVQVRERGEHSLCSLSEEKGEFDCCR